MKGNKNARIAVYALAGVYLLILAYQMFSDFDSSLVGYERVLSVIFIAIFAIVGAAMVGFGIWYGNRKMKDFKEAYYDIPEEYLEEQEKDKKEVSQDEIEEEIEQEK